jgi:hypothetical protein
VVIAFANNQTIVAIGNVATEVVTDPVPLNGNDRAACISNCHQIAATAGTPRLQYEAEVSNDGGANFEPVSAVGDTITAVGLRRVVGLVPGGLLRFRFTLDWSAGGGATDVASCCFDLHVNLDHA